MDPWDAETVQDAVDVLDDLVLWELAPQRWEQVDRILAWIDRALRARDGDDLRAAVAELELSGPVRILRIGGNQQTPVPPPVLDRRNALVHTLTRDGDRDQRQPR
jgi:hypothetical protein